MEFIEHSPIYLQAYAQVQYTTYTRNDTNRMNLHPFIRDATVRWDTITQTRRKEIQQASEGARGIGACLSFCTTISTMNLNIGFESESEIPDKEQREP
jgi:hypothetical protein